MRGNLIYRVSDHSVRTASGRIIATAPNVDAVALAFPGVTIRVVWS